MNSWRLGYNTNGFAHHRLEDALVILAQLGYKSVAVTLDHFALNPFGSTLGAELRRFNDLLQRHQLHTVVETGSRFLLDPLRKHQPTLISRSKRDREVRFDFLRRSLIVADRLGSDAVSFWSGTADDAAKPSVWMKRLVESCRAFADIAAKRHVRLAFEPEPGMFIDTMTKFAELHDRVDHPSFGLTLDVGHLHCQGELPIEAHIERWAPALWNIHIEDMKRGVHDHLMFGDGDMSFPPILRALNAVGYSGGVHVELSRHSHDAVETARRARIFLAGPGR